MLRSAITAIQNISAIEPATTESSDPQASIGVLRGSVSWTALMPVALQFGLLTLVVRQFEIETTAFFYLMLLTLAGFLIHSLLPFRLRLLFFAVLSMAAVGLVLGPRSGASLIALGCILIAICHLPISLRSRIGVLLLAGLLLAALRTEWIRAPLSPAIWPILGSMFMFRILIYLYDLSHSKDRPHPVRALSYFFLLPNVCFPLFPIVDYETFGRTYYNDQALRIYQRGIHWMFRGVTHLILYRFVYQYVSITPADVADLPDLVRYLAGDFSLFLRISGQFHLIVGMLHLFGFNLPPTSHLYFFASSFTDLWRRINIYWRDFMMKMFYYPAVFRLLKYGTIPAVVLATVFVFVVTWFLHSYQWFWLRGAFPIQWQDMVFWGILGLLVIAASVREMRRGRKRSLKVTPPLTWSGSFALSARTAATVFTMAVLWSVWFCDSPAEWLAMWPAAFQGGVSLHAGEWQLLLLAGVWLGAAKANITRFTGPVFRLGRALRASSPWGTGTLILCVYLIGQPAVHGRLGHTASQLVMNLRSDKLNTRDGVRLEKSYYESLMRVDRFNSRLWEVYAKNPIETNEWGEVGRTVQFTDDLRFKELRPNLRTSFRDRTFSTNRWGLRDRDYEKVPPAGTFRVALLGSSIEVGSGVADVENFESLLEGRLNQNDGGSVHARYEILNFGVGGYGPVEQVAVLEKKVLDFQPDAILYAAHDSDEERAVSLLAKAVFRGVSIPYPELKEITAAAAGAPSEAVASVRLKPFGRDIVTWAYRQLASRSLASNIRPIWMFLPAAHKDRTNIGYLGQVAQDAGFLVFDFSDVYGAHDLGRLRISELDFHPNPEGHQVLAERLYNELREPLFLAEPGEALPAAHQSRR